MNERELMFFAVEFFQRLGDGQDSEEELYNWLLSHKGSDLMRLSRVLQTSSETAILVAGVHLMEAKAKTAQS